eukprot:GHVU01201863.1.p1 GENE.GHVU01201863.1~~GHVU01201863.1.p1  ORF type:complete len:218 (-),score=45.22 GHVU01201863.1:1930-2583(-)
MSEHGGLSEGEFAYKEDAESAAVIDGEVSSCVTNCSSDADSDEVETSGVAYACDDPPEEPAISKPELPASSEEQEELEAHQPCSSTNGYEDRRESDAGEVGERKIVPTPQGEEERENRLWETKEVSEEAKDDERTTTRKKRSFSEMEAPCDAEKTEEDGAHEVPKSPALQCLHPLAGESYLRGELQRKKRMLLEKLEQREAESFAQQGTGSKRAGTG